MVTVSEFTVTGFWKRLDSYLRDDFPISDEEFSRVSLLMLFVVACVFDRSTGKIRRARYGSDISVLVEEIGDHFGDFRNHDRQYMWRDKLQAIERLLDVPIPFPNVFVRANNELLGRLFEYMRDACQERGVDVALLFDHRFLRLANDQIGADRAHSHMVAILSNKLASKSDSLVEAFCGTGEMFAPAGETLGEYKVDGRPVGLVRQVGLLGFELRMRFLLHGIDPRFALAANEWALAQRRFVQIDAPRSLTRTRRSRRDPDMIRPDDATNSIDMLASLRSLGGSFDGIVVVAGTARTSTNHRPSELRRWLLNRGMLSAVIDLPRTGQSGSQLGKSVWVVRSHTRPGGSGVLMVNAGALRKPRSLQEWSALAQFGANLVLLFENPEKSKLYWQKDIDASPDVERFRQIFWREFSEGYRDVVGLCSVVGYTQLSADDVPLVASTYVGRHERNAWLSGLDGSRIVDELSVTSGRGKSIYIIGNNGAGKSLLLKEIAERSAEQRRKTIGIAFGMVDRFTFSKKREGELDFFNYEGARTSANSTKSQHIANDLCRKMLDIHAAPERREALDMALGILDFERRRFLMPLEEASGSTAFDDVAAQTLELSNNAAENDELTREVRLSTMQPAFKLADKGEIAPFLKLSSGEQQMLALTLKIVATAGHGSLILVDEPEISLHVSWQRTLPLLLRRLREHFRCDIVVATHSPLVIASALDKQDICFVARDQRLTEIAINDRHSVERILFTGFETYTENNRQVHERCAAMVSEAIEKANSGQGVQDFVGQLDEELTLMRKTVQASRGQVSAGTVSRHLDLISKARQALRQLVRLSQGDKDGT